MLAPVWKSTPWSRIEFVRDSKALRWVLAAAVAGCCCSSAASTGTSSGCCSVDGKHP